MLRSRTILISALFGALALGGCQTAAIDTTETTSIGLDSAQRGAGDLESGKSHFRQANYGLAEQHFRKAVELDSGDAEGWMGLAASYDQLGRFDFADRAYAQLVQIAGRKPQVLNNMGYSHLLRGDRAKARELLLEARSGMVDTTLVDANLALLTTG